MDALERENRLWQALAAIGQDLDSLTARLVDLSMHAGMAERARITAANATSRFLMALVNRVAESNVRIEDVARLFRQHPFTEDFADQADGQRSEAALRALHELDLVTEDEVERYRLT